MTSLRLAVFAALLLLRPAALALADEDVPAQRGCPYNPNATTSFFQKSSPGNDQERLEALATVAKHQNFVCILALVERDSSHSKKLAIRRARWVLDTLTNNGVPREIIGIELRAVPSSMDRDAIRRVDVILGR